MIACASCHTRETPEWTQGLFDRLNGSPPVLCLLCANCAAALDGPSDAARTSVFAALDMEFRPEAADAAGIYRPQTTRLQ